MRTGHGGIVRKGRDCMRNLKRVSGLIFHRWLGIGKRFVSGGLGLTPAVAAKGQATSKPEGYAGSVSCRECP